MCMAVHIALSTMHRDIVSCSAVVHMSMCHKMCVTERMTIYTIMCVCVVCVLPPEQRESNREKGLAREWQCIRIASITAAKKLCNEDGVAEEKKKFDKKQVFFFFFLFFLFQFFDRRIVATVCVEAAAVVAVPDVANTIVTCYNVSMCVCVYCRKTRTKNCRQISLTMPKRKAFKDERRNGGRMRWNETKWDRLREEKTHTGDRKRGRGVTSRQRKKIHIQYIQYT